jgi:hypothetical protein
MEFILPTAKPGLQRPLPETHFDKKLIPVTVHP